jgi:hypothetical protein
VYIHAPDRDGLAGAGLGEAIRRDERHVFLLSASLKNYEAFRAAGLRQWMDL